MFAPIWAALTAFLSFALPKIALYFGIVVISNAVITPIFESLKGQALIQVSQNAGSFITAFELLGGFDFISILSSAYIMSFGLKAAARSAAAH